MIVPDYWAEARRQHRAAGKQVTVRRYGWSVTSEDDALCMAEARAEEALQQILAGENLDRREHKVAYNGAEGVPIREEVLARYGEEVITRNSYGAHCLNSPSALFADIDFTPPDVFGLAFVIFIILAAASAGAGWFLQSWGTAVGLVVFSFVIAAPLAILLRRIAVAAHGGAESIARRRLDDFLAHNPSWNIRLYRTPAGYRLLATHQPFDPTDSEVQRFFAAIAADPIYVLMCTNQRCFRARLTAKPWRIGIAAHMRPRPGVWPVHAERVALRNAWVAEYEARAAAFAACRYIESMGSGVVHAALRPVIELHDRESRAHNAGATLA